MKITKELRDKIQRTLYEKYQPKIDLLVEDRKQSITERKKHFVQNVLSDIKSCETFKKYVLSVGGYRVVNLADIENYVNNSPLMFGFTKETNYESEINAKIHALHNERDKVRDDIIIAIEYGDSKTTNLSEVFEKFGLKF